MSTKNDISIRDKLEYAHKPFQVELIEVQVKHVKDDDWAIHLIKLKVTTGRMKDCILTVPAEGVDTKGEEK